MTEEQRVVLEHELDELATSLTNLRPESDEYKATMDAIEKCNRLLEKCKESKEVEELRRERDELKAKLNENRSLLHDKEFMLKVSDWLIKASLLLLTMEWERVHVWTSRMYQNIKNLF